VCGLCNSTRSPTSKVFSFTFLSLHGFISAWYACKFLSAFSLSGSNRSFDSASVGLCTTSGVVVALLKLNSFGATVSSPNNNLNGMKLVALETEVL
jgi:hypothetical protein